MVCELQAPKHDLQIMLRYYLVLRINADHVPGVYEIWIMTSLGSA